MTFLLDTHLLLWTALQSRRLSTAACSILEDPDHRLAFSVASLWEVAMKRALGRRDFTADPRLLRRGLLENDYTEINLSAEHALAVDLLPPVHKDPFDRMLVAQALVEEITLLTADPVLARYPGPIRLV